ncbi:peptidoglycan binding domain-containing protein, partial [Candidatus Daviesbacteria bacterium]|nr:peptidoglycan binding domain-containing protein [Candidatus Daviesbacteria bacterium]
ASIATEVDQEPIDSQLKVEGGQINVTPSQEGWVVDRDILKQILIGYINTGTLESPKLPIKKALPKLSYQDALSIKKRLDEIKLSPIVLKFKDLEYTLDLDTILNLIDLKNSRSSLASLNIDETWVVESIKLANKEISDIKLTLNQEKLNLYLKDLSKQINRPVEEPLFNFDGTKVVEFRPPQEGRTLNINKAYVAISAALTTPNQSAVELPV